MLNQQKGALGSPKDAALLKLSDSVIEDPKKSYRKRAQVLNMKPTSP